MARIVIEKIAVQNAKLLRERGGKKVEFTEFGFVNSNEREAEVENFKRYKVNCRYDFHNPATSFQLIVNPRSNLVRLVGVTSNMTRGAIIKGLNEALDPYVQAEYKIGKHVLWRADERQNAKTWTYHVRDGTQFVNVLHDLMEDPDSIQFPLGSFTRE